MRSAVLSSKSAARCAVAALRISLHACAWLITSHRPSLASSSREWVPGMGARQRHRDGGEARQGNRRQRTERGGRVATWASYADPW
eukprot:scaffold95317_cov68-Phaeocystis_antarctica.AAC.5